MCHILQDLWSSLIWSPYSKASDRPTCQSSFHYFRVNMKNNQWVEARCGYFFFNWEVYFMAVKLCLACWCLLYSRGWKYAHLHENPVFRAPDTPCNFETRASRGEWTCKFLKSLPSPSCSPCLVDVASMPSHQYPWFKMAKIAVFRWISLSQGVVSAFLVHFFTLITV